MRISIYRASYCAFVFVRSHLSVGARVGTCTLTLFSIFCRGPFVPFSLLVVVVVSKFQMPKSEPFYMTTLVYT